MKFSLDWIREHAPVSAGPEEIGRRLTDAGHALDALERAGADHLLDLDIVSNRPDCMNVRGIARELAALYRVLPADLAPLLEVPETGPPVATLASVRVHVPERCARFAVRVVRGVRVGPSPDWLASRLEKAGLRPINNLVDITNYVMLELGHPLHAFDLGKLPGGEVHVRMALPGERLTTLDGVDRRLEDWMVVVADAQRARSMAGVMGGRDSEISDRTTDLLLEAAWWDPSTIYRTARQLGLSSDAAYRFERGADVEACRTAVDRAARLAAELAGGEVAAGVIDEYPGRRARTAITLRPQHAAALLGAPISDDEAADVLGRLGFEVQRSEPAWSVTVPTFRGDVRREVDLIEEIGRVVGFDRVPETLPVFASDERGMAPSRAAEHGARRHLRAAGFLEAINFTFVARADNARFAAWPEQVVEVSNPMSEKGEVLRSSLLPSLVRNAAHNFRHGAGRVRLFELGRVFRSRGGGEPPEERLHLAVVAGGPARPPHWSDARPPETGVFDLKGAFEGLFEEMGLPAPAGKDGASPFLVPGSGLVWELDGAEVGWLGLLEGSCAAAAELERPLVVGEVFVGALLERRAGAAPYRPVPRYPSIVRDLSLVVPPGVRYADLAALIRRAGKDLVTGVAPFDRYTGEGIPAGCTALGVSICFQHRDRTLVSEEVDRLQASILGALEGEMGIRLRQQ